MKKTRQNQAKLNVVIGVCGGIAAYKVINLINILKNEGVNISVVMTRGAVSMIAPKVFKEVSSGKVYTNLFQRGFDYKKVFGGKQIEHIELAKQADVVIVAPATANIVGKIANGIADDFLTTLIMATTAPVVICPSMNTNMWINPIVSENVSKLQKLNYHIIPPDEGNLACGYRGVGRLVDVKTIVFEVLKIIKNRNRLNGKKIIVTAGGTSEAIDNVRFITNRSSGKMGLAIAQQCYKQGAEVLLLRATSSLKTKYPIKEYLFQTGNELKNLIKENIEKYEVIFHPAAVGDFILENSYKGKLVSSKRIELSLIPSEKIINNIKLWNKKIKLIAFKAVYKKREKELVKIGMKKLKNSGSDYIVVNDIGREDIGFEVDDNEVYILSQKGLIKKIDKSPKREVAEQILKVVFH